jgi:actin-related protein
LESPITLDQLRKLLDELHEVEATRALTLEEAERQRAALPPWFPKVVWDAVEQKMSSLDIAKVELPIYQRYISAENADGIILYLQGPLGERLAERVMSRRAAIAETGAQGSKATQTVIDETTQADKDLATARLNQLEPADRQRVVKAWQAMMSSWKAMTDEGAKSYNDFVNDLVQTELAKHSQELAAAKQAYASKSSNEPGR